MLMLESTPMWKIVDGQSQNYRMWAAFLVKKESNNEISSQLSGTCRW